MPGQDGESQRRISATVRDTPQSRRSERPARPTGPPIPIRPIVQSPPSRSAASALRSTSDKPRPSQERPTLRETPSARNSAPPAAQMLEFTLPPVVARERQRRDLLAQRRAAELLDARDEARSSQPPPHGQTPVPAGSRLLLFAMAIALVGFGLLGLSLGLRLASESSQTAATLEPSQLVRQQPSAAAPARVTGPPIERGQRRAEEPQLVGSTARHEGTREPPVPSPKTSASPRGGTSLWDEPPPPSDAR